MAVGRINEVAALTEFSYRTEKMYGRFATEGKNIGRKTRWP